jgi:DtxR family Mn-dependent transcriptional regulator
VALSLSASLEDYLEAIFHIVQEKPAARAKDISKRMHVNRSSVTGALRALAKRDLVNYTPYDLITLTPEGTAAAADVVRRHQVLRDFLVSILAVDPPRAEATACEMEHHVDNVVLRRLGRLAEFLHECPLAGNEQWLPAFREYCERRERALTAELEATGTLVDLASRRAEQRDE